MNDQQRPCSICKNVCECIDHNIQATIALLSKTKQADSSKLNKAVNTDDVTKAQKGEALKQPCLICGQVKCDCEKHHPKPSPLNINLPQDEKTQFVLPALLKQISVHHQDPTPAKPEKTRKTLYVTPMLRAQKIKLGKDIQLKRDKYGIPQIVRYPDGRLGPKPKTSQDMLLTQD